MTSKERHDYDGRQVSCWSDSLRLAVVRTYAGLFREPQLTCGGIRVLFFRLKRIAARELGNVTCT